MEAKRAVVGEGSSNGALSVAQAAALAANPSWQRSGFEPLERFIFEFLTGGSSNASSANGGATANGKPAGTGRRAGAESVRLKLEVCDSNLQH
jgi:hypothetical protein